MAVKASDQIPSTIKQFGSQNQIGRHNLWLPTASFCDIKQCQSTVKRNGGGLYLWDFWYVNRAEFYLELTKTDILERSYVNLFSLATCLVCWWDHSVDGGHIDAQATLFRLTQNSSACSLVQSSYTKSSKRSFFSLSNQTPLLHFFSPPHVQHALIQHPL